MITDRMWARLLSSTHQPSFLSHEHVVEEEDEMAALESDLDDDVSSATDTNGF